MAQNLACSEFVGGLGQNAPSFTGLYVKRAYTTNVELSFTSTSRSDGEV